MTCIFWGGFLEKKQDPQKNLNKSKMVEAIFFREKKMKFRNQKYTSRVVPRYNSKLVWGVRPWAAMGEGAQPSKIAHSRGVVGTER